MDKIKISDLSYCEAITNNDIKVAGGKRFVLIGLRLQRLRSFWLFSTKSFEPNVLEDLESTEIDTTSKYTINKLNNPTTGESGYQITSADGNSSSIVLSSPSSQKSFSIALG